MVAKAPGNGKTKKQVSKKSETKNVIAAPSGQYASPHKYSTSHTPENGKGHARVFLKKADASVTYVTKSQGEKILDRQAKKYLDMSGDEFLRQYEAGEIEEPDRSEVIRVAMLIPFTKR